MFFSPDRDLRDQERRGEFVSVDQQAAFLAQLMRHSRLCIEDIFLAAIYGHQASLRLVEVPDRLRLDTVQVEEMRHVLSWFFGSRAIPEKTVEFLSTMGPRYEEALSMTIHYLGILQELDRGVPDRKHIFPALMDHLVRFPELLETISAMEEPILQLLPIFNDPDAGFLRLINPVDHRCTRSGPAFIDVHSELRDAWGTMSITRACIVGWRLAITEGALTLPSDGHFIDSRRLEEHWRQWSQQRESWECSDPISYLLLQLPRLYQYPRSELMDDDRVMVLGCSDSADGACVLAHFEPDGLLTFFSQSPHSLAENIRIRASVSIPLPNF